MGQAVAYDAILGGGATPRNLRQVRRSDIAVNARVLSGRASGAAVPAAYFGDGAEPVVTMETGDVAGLLGLAGFSVSSGLYVNGDTITVPLIERALGGIYSSGAAHNAVTGTKALILPMSFAASQEDEAAIATLEAHFLSADGLTAPWAFNVNQSLAAQAFNAQYKMGPVVVNGSQVAKVTGFTINPGLRIEKKTYDGAAYPTDAYIPTDQPIMPFADVTFENVAGANAFGLLFTAATGATLYFRKRSPGGVFVADATEEHIAFTLATGGIAHIESISASGGSNATVTLRVYGVSLSVSPTAAISIS